MISEDGKFQILYDHYKDTIDSIKEVNKIRDRLFVFAVFLVGAMFFQIVSPRNSSNAISSFLSLKTGFLLNSNTDTINGIIWFFLFTVVLRYFQLVISTERQYTYLHEVEEKLNTLCQKENFITREGKTYLDKYPCFSNWVHWIYRIIFPSVLIIAVFIKIFGEWINRNCFSASLFFDSSIFICIIITTVLYLCYNYFEK